MIYFLGIDVSKSVLDIAVVKDGIVIKEGHVENEKVNLRRFLKEVFQEFKTSSEYMLACIEHTGIYNYRALEVLQKCKVKICLEPALRIKQSQGMTRGKDDQIDARRIAIYAYKNRQELTLWQPQRRILQQLQALLSLRERLIKTKVQLEVPLQESTGYIENDIAKSLKATSLPIIRMINKQLLHLEEKLRTLVRSDDQVSRQHDLIISVPGVGDVTAWNMIIRTGEFSLIKEPKQFACYAGVAPFKHQSGSSIRGRTRVSHLANMTMKKLLHLAAMSAIQCSKEMKVYYQRKVKAGKNKMSVINAVRNKLISRVFACVREGRHYQNNYQHTLA